APFRLVRLDSLAQIIERRLAQTFACADLCTGDDRADAAAFEFLSRGSHSCEIHDGVARIRARGRWLDPRTRIARDADFGFLNNVFSSPRAATNRAAYCCRGHCRLRLVAFGDR